MILEGESANGKAIEYACLAALAAHLNARGAIVEVQADAPAVRTARRRFDALAPTARSAYETGARAGIEMLASAEPRLRSPREARHTLTLQIDALGAIGDVSDLLLTRADGWQLGVLVKHNNDAAKHPRLSASLDFARGWFGSPASPVYFAAVKPVFDELASYARTGSHWSALALRDAEKVARFYRPVLAALASEVRTQMSAKPVLAANLIRYMTGRRDFYKLIVTIKARRTELLAFNFDGELGRRTDGVATINSAVAPARLPLPTRLLAIDFKPRSLNTLVARFDQGWTLTMRLHSASSRVENSLKLDVRLAETPAGLMRSATSWRV